MTFEWDDANISHLATHRVTPEQFEQAFQLDPLDLDANDVDGETRYRTVGPTASGRLLVMVWTLRGDGVRAVTAFTAGPLTTKEWRNRQ